MDSKNLCIVILCKQISKASQICVINIDLYLHFISLRMPQVINTQNSLNMPVLKDLNINLLVQTLQYYEDPFDLFVFAMLILQLAEGVDSVQNKDS